MNARENLNVKSRKSEKPEITYEYILHAMKYLSYDEPN